MKLLLVITTSPVTRSFFARIEDYSPIFATSEADALESLTRSEVSCIVLDEKNAGLDPFALCVKIRALPEHAHTPLVVITGHLKKSFIRSLLKAGATDFLTEPLTSEEFHLRMDVATKKEKTEAKMKKITPKPKGTQ